MITFWRGAGWQTRAAMLMLLALALGALLVPALARTDPLAIGDALALRLLPPFSIDATHQFHLLGTDAFGRDLFVRAMLAGRLSLAVGIAGSVLAGCVGIAIGAIGGWQGGVIDRVALATGDVLLAIPRLIILLVCAALWPPGATMVITILVLTGWMGVARLVRGEVRGLRARPFVESAQAMGASPSRVLWKHVIPNALAPAIVAIALGVGSAVLLESGLSFLGLGIQPPAPSWGNMIADGRELIVLAPWIALAPGIALILTVLCCTLLGDAMRDRLAGDELETMRARS
ncbi:MAG TPA: ABC transporter permease [Gemmatimonadaceae bacterium]|nr:ABC transporter permease [Gemmatimonadaceae bacterium]